MQGKTRHLNGYEHTVMAGQQHLFQAGAEASRAAQKAPAFIFCPECGARVPWAERHRHECARRWLRAQGIPDYAESYEL
jgi:hypothetical protein